MRGDGFVEDLDRLFLVVTNHCDARCQLCQYGKSRPRRFLSQGGVAEKVLPLIKGYNIGLTLITGGEPTLHPQLPGIVNALAGTGTGITLITNASRLDMVFDDIKDRVDAYMFSLDAANEALYSEIRGLDHFHRLLGWPGKIVEYRPYARVAFNCLIQKKNISDLVNIYRLAVDLPVEGIFFNVPELKPYCFGREETVPVESRESGLLEEEEIGILEENLAKIVQLDAGIGKLFQRQGFFDRCVRYFRALRLDRRVVFNDPGEVCQVPFTSIIFDETQCLSPCFYLPYFVPCAGYDDLVNCDYLRDTRKEMLCNHNWRERHCSFCLQFQG
jgi:MoaA/NifB/PqqE/SkfB family radical SAM enzyme